MNCFHWIGLVLSVLGVGSKSHTEARKSLYPVPSQPTNVTVAAVSSTEVLVTWSPTFVSGVDNYTVALYNLTLSYPQPPACPVPPLAPRRVVVGGNVTQATVGGLGPATSVSVTVTAATSAGYGPPSDPVTSTTLDGVSDPVVGLNVTLSLTKVWLSWLQPCLTNGVLDHFLIHLNGTRPNHITARYTLNISAQQVSAGSYSTTLNLSLLTAESVYSAIVIPVGASGNLGKYSSHDFFVPSRIPARPSDSVFAQLPPVTTTRSTATVSIRSDLFPDTEGSIRYYALMVARNFSHGPQTGKVHNQSWPKSLTWANVVQSYPMAAYQATQSWWNPFRGMNTTSFEVKQYVLGSEQCSKTDLTSFCNGPLLPGASYSVRIRAFTRSGYRDSQSLTFQTVDPIVEAYLIVLALVILAAVTSAAFVYLVVKGHIEWNNTITSRIVYSMQ